MISDKIGQQLHSRFSEGPLLTQKEQKQLQEWYDFHDKQEENLLMDNSKEFDINTLKVQIQTTLSQLTILTQKVSELTKENERIKKTNQQLRKKFLTSIIVTS